MFKKLMLTMILLVTNISNATLITDNSGLGTNVTGLGVTTVGGIVVDLEGINGVNVVSQLSANSLLNGFCNVDPCLIGTQTGFSAGVLGALGGGLSGASIRFTLFDGDSGAGDFDFNQNTLLINGFAFGNWSSVNAENTDSNGASLGTTSGGGFRDDLLDTGWFTSVDAGLMASLFTSLNNTNQLIFELSDTDPGDNFFDFTQGLDQSLIDVDRGPSASVPEPATFALVSLALLGFSYRRRV
jgi:hypothetical protein